MRSLSGEHLYELLYKPKTKNFKLIDTIFLSANSRGTELTYSVEVKYKGIFIIVGLFIGPVWTKLMNTQIKNLEEVLGPV